MVDTEVASSAFRYQGINETDLSKYPAAAGFRSNAGASCSITFSVLLLVAFLSIQVLAIFCAPLSFEISHIG